MAKNHLEDLEKSLAEYATNLNRLANSLPNQDYFAKNVAPPQRKKMSSDTKAFLGGSLFLAACIGIFIANVNTSNKKPIKNYEQRYSYVNLKQNSPSQVNNNVENNYQTSPAQAAVQEISPVALDFSGWRINHQGLSSLDSGSCYLENRYDNSNHLYLFRGYSYSFGFNLSRKPSNARLTVRHLSSGANGQEGVTPITLYVNKNAVARWRQIGGGYSDSTVSIEDYLKEGENKVSFEYASNEGTTGYWQKAVRIEME